MNKEEFLKEYEKVRVKKIEDMPIEEIDDLLQKSIEVKLSPIRPIPYKGEIDEVVVYEYPELTADCPMTRIQDLYTIRITYIPDKYVPELKSLKMYFLDYKNLPISHENLCAKIYKEFKEAVKPKKLKVELEVAVRGGIKTTIRYEK